MLSKFLVGAVLITNSAIKGQGFSVLANRGKNCAINAPGAVSTPDEWSSFVKLLNDLDRIPSMGGFRRPSNALFLDIKETPASYEVLVEVPGIPKESVKISV